MTGEELLAFLYDTRDRLGHLYEMTHLVEPPNVRSVLDTEIYLLIQQFETLITKIEGGP